MPDRVSRQKQIPRFRPGDSLNTSFSASVMNRIVDFCNAFLAGQIVRADSDDWIVSDSNFVLQLAKEAAASSTPAGPTLSEFVVKAIQPNSLQCVAVADESKCDGMTSVSIVTVNKPTLLQNNVTSRKNVAGVTISYVYDTTMGSPTRYVLRTATGVGYNAETQVVVPNYLAGGFTGAFPKAGGDHIFAAKTDSGIYIDDNIDSRKWTTTPVTPAP